MLYAPPLLFFTPSLFCPLLPSFDCLFKVLLLCTKCSIIAAPKCDDGCALFSCSLKVNWIELFSLLTIVFVSQDTKVKYCFNNWRWSNWGFFIGQSELDTLGVSECDPLSFWVALDNECLSCLAIDPISDECLCCLASLIWLDRFKEMLKISDLALFFVIFFKSKCLLLQKRKKKNGCQNCVSLDKRPFSFSFFYFLFYTKKKWFHHLMMTKKKIKERKGKCV